VYSSLGYTSDKFIYADFAKKYDTELVLQHFLLYLTLSLANGIEKQEINGECVKKVTQILRVSDVDPAEIDLSQCHISINDFLSGNGKILEYDYDYRYRLMESLLYIFFYNEKKIRKYPEFIKIATYLKIKKTDFVYLFNKYKGA